MTSLAFMLVLVPEPVWNTSSGKLRVVPALRDLERGLLDGRGTLGVEAVEIECWWSPRPT